MMKSRSTDTQLALGKQDDPWIYYKPYRIDYIWAKDIRISDLMVTYTEPDHLPYPYCSGREI